MGTGIDAGGTFTDGVMVDEATGAFHHTKTPTTHHDLAEGVLKGLGEILEAGGVSMDRVSYLIHGTTIGTNAIVERKGARVGLVNTAGFEDVLEIRRVTRPKEAAFDFGADNPPPLVPRYLRKGVLERIDGRGGIVLSLGEASVREAAAAVGREGVEAVVVSLLFSFVNGEHERREAGVLEEHLPGIPVTLSSEIRPEFREYERTCTAVMNGYLGPVRTHVADPMGLSVEEADAGILPIVNADMAKGISGNTVERGYGPACSPAATGRPAPTASRGWTRRPGSGSATSRSRAGGRARRRNRGPGRHGGPSKNLRPVEESRRGRSPGRLQGRGVRTDVDWRAVRAGALHPRAPSQHTCLNGKPKGGGTS